MTSLAPTWRERNPGELLLTIFEPRRRWFRRRSAWSLEWRYGRDELHDKGEFAIELATGWCDPHYTLKEIRLPAGSYREWLR